MAEYVYYSRGVPLKDCYGDISLPHEKIVRCRDCKYREAGLEPPFYCLRLGEYKEFCTDLNGFCAWGEQREEGELNESFQMR